MHLMYYTGPSGRRVYTLRKTAPDGSPTRSAHPGASRDAHLDGARRLVATRISASAALIGRLIRHRVFAPHSHLPCRAARFSPDDKFSRHRVTIKKRYGLLLTQQPAPDQ
jgi:H/ACA ribonucleoprotein complex subunit 3